MTTLAPSQNQVYRVYHFTISRREWVESEPGVSRLSFQLLGLDVFEGEPAVHPGLMGLDNVVMLPHLGSATVATRRKMALMAAGNVAAVLAGEAALNPVG